MPRFSVCVSIALALLVAALSGCSQEGTLVIENKAATDFTGTVDGTQVTIDPGDQYATSVYIGKSLAIVGPDKINVIVSGSATTKRAFTDEVGIKAGETTGYTVQNDVGAILFTNLHIKAVNEIKISECGSFDWGPNLLAPKQTVPPGATVTLQIEGGCWNILINYDREQKLDSVGPVEVNIGQVYEMEWEPPLPPAPAR